MPSLANDNINVVSLSSLESEVADKCGELLKALMIDFKSDHNTRETPNRMAKMFIREIFSGRYNPCPKVTEFPNIKNFDQLYSIGPITINSTCSHHFLPFTGNAWLGVIPSNRILGLSKFKRLADWIFNRPQIQEEATIQLADLIEEKTKPRAIGLIVKARHMCMAVRGVKESETSMTTSVMRGIFRENLNARQEFLEIIRQ